MKNGTLVFSYHMLGSASSHLLLAADQKCWCCQIQSGGQDWRVLVVAVRMKISIVEVQEIKNGRGNSAENCP